LFVGGLGFSLSQAPAGKRIGKLVNLPGGKKGARVEEQQKRGVRDALTDWDGG